LGSDVSEQLNIQFGVDATRAIRAAEQAGALAGKLFGRKFNESIESEIKTEEIQLSVNFEGAEQVEKASKATNLYKKRAEELTRKLDELSIAERKAANSAKKLKEAMGRGPFKSLPSQVQKSIVKLQQMRAETKKNTQAYKNLTRAIARMQDRLRHMGGSVPKIQQTGAAVGGLTQKFALANVAASYVTTGINTLVSSLGQLFEAMDNRAMQVEALALAMKGAGVEGMQLEGVMKSIKATALTYGVSVEDVATAWKRLGPTVLAAGGSLKEAESVIIAMSARVVSLGLSSEQTGRYMEALAQVIGKGKLQGEELTKQISQLDGGLRSLVEKELQATVKGFTTLEEEMKNGAVSADMFTKAFIKVSEDAVNKLKTEMQDLNVAFSTYRKEGNMTLAQMQNKIKALNTMSLDNITGSLDSMSRMSWRMQANWSKAILKITSENKYFMSSVKDMSDTLSTLAETANNVLIILAQFGSNQVLVGIQKLAGIINPLGAGVGLMNLFKDIPGVRKMFEDMNLDMDKFMNNITRTNNLDLNLLEDTLSNVNTELAETGELSENTAKQLDDLFKAETKRMDEILSIVKRRAEVEKEAHQEKIDDLREQKEQEKEFYDDMVQRVKDRYDKEKEEIDKIREAVQERYELEEGVLNEKTGAEKRLEEMRRKELQTKAANQNLSEKERLQAQASLDQMNRRVKLEELRLQRKKEKKKLDEREKQAQKDKDEGLKNEKKLYENVIKAVDERIKKEEDAIKAIDQGVKDLDRSVQEAKSREYELIQGNKAAAIAALEEQIRTVNRLQTAYEDAAKAAPNGAGENPDGRATGGPVTGGATYTVNEAGKEAFLSAAGRLSMIKAPAFGKWKAPSHGTVIPAHLTQKLDIPKAGVNLGRTSTRGSESAASNSMNMHRIVNAIGGIGGGDNISNNVTIQSVNPGKTASDMLVSMTKIRRRRLR